jgi:hypothetical protein
LLRSVRPAYKISHSSSEARLRSSPCKMAPTLASLEGEEKFDEGASGRGDNDGANGSGPAPPLPPEHHSDGDTMGPNGV